MELNETPRAVRLHIAFFGRSNVGKSSLINAVTGQETAIVSAVAGTTADPVYKAMEIPPLGPCVVIDTAGLDDTGELGRLRMEKSLEILRKTDIAVFVAEAASPANAREREILAAVKKRGIPVVVAVNKADTVPVDVARWERDTGIRSIAVSAATGEGVGELVAALAGISLPEDGKRRIVGDLVREGDFVVLVTPIDKAAPKGRLILPQQQVIRELIESGAVTVVAGTDGLGHVFSALSRAPRLVITDSQVFSKADAQTPPHVPLTSFSILFARYKGDLAELARGAGAVSSLKDGDKILIAEACTHHRQEDDIGRVKIPRWLRGKTGRRLVFEYASGGSFGRDIAQYALIVHCGGCMINCAEMNYRMALAREHGVPMVNYGVLIAHIEGILPRALEPFSSEGRVFEGGGP